MGCPSTRTWRFPWRGLLLWTILSVCATLAPGTLPVHAAVLSLDQQAQDILNDPETRVAEGGSFSLGDVPVLDEIDFVRDVKLQGLRQRGTR